MSNAVDSAATPLLSAEQPWPGLMSFPEDGRAYFHGRDDEIDELYRLLQRDTLTVLFGQSGLGKSSLLRAGLFPRLRQDDYLPVYLRFDFSGHAPALVDQVFAALHQEFLRHRVEAPPPQPGQSLWAYFHAVDTVFWSARNRLLRPVLVFDQFEEIFTLGRGNAELAEQVHQVIEQLACLIENMVPPELEAQWAEQPELAGQYDYGKQLVKVLLSFREDALPEMEGLRPRIRSIARNRLRLTWMNGSQALAAVATTGGALVTPPVAEQIVRFVAASRYGLEGQETLEVEPALLSIVCRELNNQRLSAGATQIQAELLAGGVPEQIIHHFYEDAFAGQDPRLRAFVEDQLLTEAGYRDSYALDDAMALPGVSAAGVEWLVARRVLRLEERFGVRRVELTHDILTRVAKESRDQRLDRQARAEQQAAEAARSRRTRRLLAGSAVAVVATLGLALVFAGLYRETLREKNRVVQAQSHVLLSQAISGLESGQSGDPAAYLAQAIRLDPGNSGAVARALTLLSQRPRAQLIRAATLTSGNPADQESAVGAGVGSQLHNLDGQQLLLTMADGRIQRWDAALGKVLYPAVVVPLGRVPLDDASIQPRLVWRAERLSHGAAYNPTADLLDELRADVQHPGVLAWGSDKHLLLFDVSRGRMIGPALTLPAAAQRLAVSADQRWLAVAAGGAIYRYALKDAATPPDAAAAAAGVASHTPSASTLAVSPRAEWVSALAVPPRTLEISTQGTVLWSSADGAWLQAAAAATSPATPPVALGKLTGQARFSVDGQLVFAPQASDVAVLHATRGTRVATLHHGAPISDLQLAPSGRWLVSHGLDRYARLWDLRSMALAVPPLAHDAAVVAASFSPDEAYLMTSSLDRTARIWSTRSGAAQGEPLVHGSPVVAAAIQNDGRTAHTLTASGQLGRWQVRAATPVQVPLAAPARMLLIGPAGLLATADDLGQVTLFQTAPGVTQPLLAPQRLWQRKLAEGRVNSMVFSADGQYLAVADQQGGIRLVDLKQAGLPLREASQRGSVHMLAFSPDGSLLLSAGEDGSSRIWSSHDLRPQGLPGVHASAVTQARFSPDGHLVLSWAEDQRLLVRDAATGLHVQQGAFPGLVLADFSADGQVLVIHGRSLVRWHGPGRTSGATRRGRPEPWVVGQRVDTSGKIWKAALNPARDVAVTAGIDGGAQLWNLRTLRPFGALMRHGGLVQHASFSADGRWLLTHAADGLWRIWDARSGALVADPRPLSADRSLALSSTGDFVAMTNGSMLEWSVLGLGRYQAPPPWFAELLEASAGLRLDAEGTMSRLSDPAQQLAALDTRSGTASWQAWGAWYRTRFLEPDVKRQP